MRQYKKRTIALILASVITVVGAFGADNYKNSLMLLKFESDSNGAVNMTLFTKSNYASPVNAIRKDVSTYVIMLPETNCEKDIPKEISGGVNSVDIRTMPYTASSNGYTKITVKTLPNTLLSTKKAIYVPTVKPVEQIVASPNKETKENSYENPYSTSSGSIPAKSENVSFQNQTENNNAGYNSQKTDNEVKIKKAAQDIESSSNQTQVNKKKTNNIKSKEPQESSEPYEQILFLLGLTFVIICIVYFYIKGKNKMTEILGEQVDFDISDKEEKDKKKKTKVQKIKNTINNIDKMYQKPTILSKEIMSNSFSEVQQTQEDYVEESNVVDLDELFQEKSKASDSNKTEEQSDNDENDDLSDFLNTFSFESEEEESKTEIEQQEFFNEELFENLIKNEKIRFSDADISKINELLSTEINDDTMKNISKYVVTNPIENKRPSHTEILENLITSYTINQNITFTADDISDLRKLISVEIDPDFISDLRTNPQKVQEMRKEIEDKKSHVHRHSELLTLNVKDMLPDLSEELRKQGGRTVESNAKPEVIYFSEGYEVSTLSLKDELPDLAVEINNKDAYISRPSDEIPIVESGYQFEKLSVNDELKDISKAFEESENAEKKEAVKPVADENALMQSISNVTFKPFYDGSESFEIINDFEEDKEEEMEVPTVSDVQKEFSNFEGFTIVGEDEENDKNETLEDFPEEIPQVDLIEEEEVQDAVDSIAEPEQVKTFYNLDRKISEHKVYEKDKNAQELLRIIEEQQKERKRKIQELRENRKKTLKVKAEKQADIIEKAFQKPVSEKNSCVVENSEYEIIISSEFTDKSGCSLAKDDKGGYIVLGYIGDRKIKLKQYGSLKTEKLETRVRAKLVDGGNQYIVKIGLHKFILNVFPNNMEFVMDLC